MGYLMVYAVVVEAFDPQALLLPDCQTQVKLIAVNLSLYHA